jgi:hypothetical protein
MKFRVVHQPTPARSPFRIVRAVHEPRGRLDQSFPGSRVPSPRGRHHAAELCA